MKGVAVLGVRSLVGRELLSILEQRNYPVQEIYLFEPDVDAGKNVIFNGRPVEVASSYNEFLDKVDLVFCCLDRVRTRAIVPKFKKRSLVIDLSGAFRFAPEALHMIPEINGQEIKEHKGIVANPSPVSIQLLLALAPLHKKFALQCLHLITLNAVSDYGEDALDELDYEYEFLAVQEQVEKAQDSVFPQTIGGNLIPQIGDFEHKGYTEEENLLKKEITGMLGKNDILVAATCIWVPIRRVNCVAVFMGFKEEIPVAEARKVLAEAPGVRMTKHDEEYPTPELVAGKDEVFVGRLRREPVFSNGLTMWIVADNLRKGSALNAVQIAEQIIS